MPTPTELVTIPLKVEAKGELVANNFDAFNEAVRAKLEEINEKPETDEEFGQARVDVKAIKAVEDLINGAKDDLIKQIAAISEAHEDMDGLIEDLSNVRLPLSKKIDAENAKRRADLIAEYTSKIELDAGFRDAHADKKGLADAIKGKSSVDSMKKALGIKAVEINMNLSATRDVITEFIQNHGEDLFSDHRTLAMRPAGEVQVEMQSRVDQKIERDKRIAAEEAVKKAAAEAEAAKEPTPEQSPPKEEAQTVDPPSEPLESIEPEPDDAAKEELAAYIETIRTAFGPVKASREALTTPYARAKAEAFSNGIRDAWKELNA